MFIARLTSPTTSNEYYIVTSAGGLNECIEIENGSALPNCVGYAWGRVYEYLGSKPKLSKGNAGDWYNYNDGYARGNIPKLGAVLCYSKEGDAGHVAIVEKINSDGSIVTSESGYGSSRFWTATRSDDGNWGQSLSYQFQGFIYPLVTNSGDIGNNNRRSKSKFILFRRNKNE